MTMGQYGGRDFSKKSSHATFLGDKGDRGIPPQMPGKGGKSKGIEFLGKKGDKGMGTGSVPKSKGAPAD